MKKFLISAAAAATMLGVANAATMTVDPDSFASGTDISNAFPGVTLSTIFATGFFDTPSAVGAVFAVADANATTGANAFGQGASNSTWGNGGFEFLRIDFASIVSSVSLDFFANDSGGDTNPVLLAFDTSGNQIDMAEFLGNVPFGSPLTLTVMGNISFIFASWDNVDRLSNGGLDNLSFTTGDPVPLPAAALLFATGAAGLFARRRRKA